MKEFFDFAGEHPIVTTVLACAMFVAIGNIFRPKVVVIQPGKKSDDD